MVSTWLQRIAGRNRATPLFSFIALLAAALAWLSASSPAAAQGADPNAYVTADLNLRAGPDTDYPAIIIIPAGQYVTVYACIPDLTWCDISYGENRGWAAAEYIQAYYQNQYMTVQQYAPLVSLPTAAFDIRAYWNSYYTSQPFYAQLDTWAAPRPAVRTTSFYEPLGSYGDWVQVQDQYVWVPHGVDAGWRPYTRGHWEDTDQGWFWVSTEPFGWATYHYGRWGFSHDVGWFWVPGTVWAPAWVAWRGSDSYLGWAPLPPAPDAGLAVSISIGAVPDYYWSVVPAQSFLSVNIGVALVPQVSFGAIFAQTQPLGSTTIINNVVVNKTVNITYVEQKTGQKVVVQKVAAAGAGGPGAAGKLAVFTPPPAGEGLKKPPKLRKVEEVAAVSQTKVQAGNEKALDLTTTRKLKGPPPGKKLEAGGPPPPPPPPGGGNKGATGNKAGSEGLNCGADEHPENGRCVANGVKCGPREHPENGRCVPNAPKCGPKEHLDNGACVPNAVKCGPREHEENGACVANEPKCGPKQHLDNGACVPNAVKCGPREHEENGACVPNAAKCGPKEHMDNGNCVPNAPKCGPREHEENGTCVPNASQKEANKPPPPPKSIQCPQGEHPQGGACVPNPPPKGAGGPPPGAKGPGGPPPGGKEPPCPAGKHRGPDGQCH